MSLFFLLAAERMPMPPVRPAATTPPARVPRPFTNLRRVIMLVLAILGLSQISRIHAVETNPHPDPLPFMKGEGNLRWHRVRITAQQTEATRSSFPLPARSGDQAEGRTAYLHPIGTRLRQIEFQP